MRVVDKLLEPKEMELPDAAYEGAKLADDPRYGKPCGSAQLAKTLAVYDRADPAAARVIIATGSDFEGTSPKVLAGNSHILAARCRVEPDVDLGGGDKVRDALRTRATAVRRNERSPACGWASRAVERR